MLRACNDDRLTLMRQRFAAMRVAQENEKARMEVGKEHDRLLSEFHPTQWASKHLQGPAVPS